VHGLSNEQQLLSQQHRRLQQQQKQLSLETAAAEMPNTATLPSADAGKRTPVNEWTGAEAYAWVSGLGPNFASSHAESLALVGCLDNGEALLSLNEDDLASDELGIPPEDAALFMNALRRLVAAENGAPTLDGKGESNDKFSAGPPPPPPPSTELAAALASGLSPVTTAARYAASKNAASAENDTGAAAATDSAAVETPSGGDAAVETSATSHNGTPVNEWTGAEAYAWVSGLGPNFASSHAKSLALVGCLDNGEALLSLNEDDLASDELGIPPEDAALFMNALRRLVAAENSVPFDGQSQGHPASSGLPPPPPAAVELAAALASGF